MPALLAELRPDVRIVAFIHTPWCSPTELAVLPVEIWRLDLASGVRTQVQRFMPPDPAGHLQVRSVFLTPDAKTVAYTYDRKLSELFQVEGLAR